MGDRAVLRRSAALLLLAVAPAALMAFNESRTPHPTPPPTPSLADFARGLRLERSHVRDGNATIVISDSDVETSTPPQAPAPRQTPSPSETPSAPGNATDSGLSRAAWEDKYLGQLARVASLESHLRLALHDLLQCWDEFYGEDDPKVREETLRGALEGALLQRERLSHQLTLARASLESIRQGAAAAGVEAAAGE